MKEKTRTQLDNELRAKWFKLIQNCVGELEEVDETLIQKSNVFAIPVLDSEDNEATVLVTVTIPKGSRDDDEGYDCYAVRDSFLVTQKEKEEKAKAKAEAKAKKIARDKADREAKKAQKEKGE